MKILSDYDLTKLNTFGVSVKANFFTEINNQLETQELFNLPVFKENKKLFLGGGSNILFTKDFDGIVILNKLKGIQVVEENDDEVFLKSMSGEIWHDVVLFAVDHNYWGIENLSLIPGTTGAAPIQNIGAYGVELKDTIDSIEAVDIQTGEARIFKKEECDFGYRDSIFKNKLKDKYFIVAINLKLKKKPSPNLSYKILSDFIENNGINISNPKNISEAVSSIRRSKLPDPKEIGNAGSFFKNVLIDKERLEDFLKNYPDVPYFEEDERVKIPSAWLIEKCGWKGYRAGDVGVHEKQALVLVNYGNGTGQEINDLALKIIESVKEKFNLAITPEVNII